MRRHLDGISGRAVPLPLVHSLTALRSTPALQTARTSGAGLTTSRSLLAPTTHVSSCGGLGHLAWADHDASLVALFNSTAGCSSPGHDPNSNVAFHAITLLQAGGGRGGWLPA